MKRPGTTNPSFKYLEPVGVTSKQHPLRAKYLHNKNDSSMGTCPTSSSSPSFTDKPPLSIKPPSLLSPLLMVFEKQYSPRGLNTEITECEYTLLYFLLYEVFIESKQEF